MRSRSTAVVSNGNVGMLLVRRFQFANELGEGFEGWVCVHVAEPMHDVVAHPMNLLLPRTASADVTCSRRPQPARGCQ